MTDAARRKRIRLMAGPGTLPSQGRDRMDLTHYNVRFSGKPRLATSEMTAAFPEIAAIADVSHDDEGPNDQSTHEDLRRLARKIDLLMRRDDIDGLVYVQGTNTLEETAFFLNVTVRTRKPIVVVGAQRPFTAISTDAHLNLVNAIRVAASDDAIAETTVPRLQKECMKGRKERPTCCSTKTPWLFIAMKHSE